jgi:uncharacterized protein YodC (DUF2158 family)
MIRLFKAGDRVKSGSDGPVMEVIKYISKHDWFMGDYVSDFEVECVWFDPEEGRKIKTFDQRKLFKIDYETEVDENRKTIIPVGSEER